MPAHSRSRQSVCAYLILLMPRLLFFVLLCLPGLSLAAHQENWETGYTGADATGTHVLGYWKFDAGSELKDSSGKGHDLVLNGAAAATEGRLGHSMTCGYDLKQAHGLRVTGAGRLSPVGAFTLEMWIQPGADHAQAGRCYLADKRYVIDNHTDYTWQLLEPETNGARRLWVTLGFGSVSETFASEPIPMVADQWQHIAFSYDAAGTVTFYRNGSLISQAYKPGFGPVVPGVRALHLGDRIGSNYGGFPGRIDEVRLCEGALRFEPLALEIRSPRHVWQRMEKNASVELHCQNLSRNPVADAQLTLEYGGKAETFVLPALNPGGDHAVKFTIDTSLKPERYRLRASLRSGETVIEQGLECEIVARPAPQMPVIMWGADGSEMERLKQIGFTHYIGISNPDFEKLWETRTDKRNIPPPSSAESLAAKSQELDAALAKGLKLVASVSPSRWLENKTELLRVDRAGKPYPRKDICASLPELPGFYENVGRSLSRAYGQHPAFDAALVDTEVRDASQPSFNEIDRTNYRTFAGAEIPDAVIARNGVEWKKLKDFPADRVISDEYPLLKYYRWFWTVGDGWNNLHSALHQGLKNSARPGFWTFFDPAVRQPSISGAGGSVDVLSHWTYTYPDPQRIGLCTDQLIAMSEATGRRQRVMKMTQLIWYRSQTAPIRKAQPDDVIAWDDHDPDAAYITIAPMHLKEALWTKLSRPIQGIMYHGWQSLVPTDSTGSYRYTNPNTVHVLTELLHDIVQPLGPTLLRLTDERAEVALLESFTSQMFARRGGYGNNMGWSADVWMALQHAHIRTDVMYEETLLKKGLSGRKILIMPDCDVLSESVVQRIQEWQKRGGKIIADENLCPGLQADIPLTSFRRVKKAAEDKAKLLALAETLGPQVASLGHTPKVTADSPEVILRTRLYGDATYLFVINDKREAGTYVGQNGLVLENGLPTTANITLTQDNASIYELSRSELIIPQRDAEGHLKWKVELGPCDGRLYMILPKPLLQLRCDVPATAKPGQTAALKIQLTSTQEAVLKAAVPVEIEIRDANGKRAEGSGFYTVENGLLELPLEIAHNDDPGSWEVRVRERASGMSVVKWMSVGL
ncbi:MG2 domain-containing protein [Prosthecobacter debontii]|uniref:MG2 domain-containing protein n=2 Tax=Prosthecobacter debontii TaxID=48467 RepID=A0A1T4YYX9_9BACT|nr:MG2 domain-containing protein [Prosthecobacter debontii]